MNYLISNIFWARMLTLASIPLHNSAKHSVSKSYSSYRPSPYCNPSEYFRYPTTIKDVVSIVKEAIEKNLTVKVFGSRHSQSDIICTEGIPIENYGLRTPMQINPDGTATLGAGISLHEATVFLRENGRAFKTTPAFGNITLGGAIGTGAHGSSIKHKSSISSQVVGMTIVDGLGNIQKITSKEDLNSFRIHLGLLAIVVDVTLITHPLYKTLAHNYVVEEDVLVNGLAHKWARETDQISLYWFPSIEKVVVANWTIVDVNTPGDAYTNDHVPPTSDTFNLIVKHTMERLQVIAQSSCSLISNIGKSLIKSSEVFALSSLVVQTPDFVPIYTEDGEKVLNPAVGFYDRMFAPTCVEQGPSGSLQCPWGHGRVRGNVTILDNEISLDLDDMPEFIKDVKDILKVAPAAFPSQGILMRFSAKADEYMSSAYGRDTVHFEFYLIHRKYRHRDAVASVDSYQTIMQILAKKYKGRSHWGKSGSVYQSRDMLDLKLDPTARSKFVASMEKFDPNGVFMNNFGRRLKRTGSTIDMERAALKHCALLDNCFCSLDTDCAAYQRCTHLQGYDYPVCQNILDDEEDYDGDDDDDNENKKTAKQLLHIPDVSLGLVHWLDTVVPNLIERIRKTGSCILRKVKLNRPMILNIKPLIEQSQ